MAGMDADEKEAFLLAEEEKKNQPPLPGEEPEEEPRDWTPYKYAPYKTKKVQYVLCLNTMGQDRQFTQEERDYALRCVQAFRDRWEESETNHLLRDIQYKLG